MSEAFDPYRKWLGIPPEEQPPHYYRLLGLVPFETDPEVITTAVDGRMALLKRFQSGQYAAASQQLLNQIAAAKVCLLNAEKRSAYDAQLRVRLGDEKKPPKAEPAARKPAADTAQPDMPAIKVAVVTAPAATSKARTTGNGKPAARRRWQWPTLAGVAVLLIVVVVVIAASNRNDGSGATPADNGKSLAAAGDEAKKPKPNGAAKPTKPSDTPTESTNDQVAPPVKPRILGDLIPLDPPDPSTPTSPTEPPKAEPVEPSKPVEPSAEPKPAAKLPVPDAAEQQAAEKQIREVFKAEFAAAKKAEDKQKLAATLLAQARQSDNTPPVRYVLFRLAISLTVDGGDLTAALSLVDELASLYETSALSAKLSLLDDALKARGGDLVPVIYDAALQLYDTATGVDDFELAKRANKVAAMSARRIKDKLAEGAAVTRENELDSLKRRHAKMLEAKATLATAPDDNEANQLVGAWLCMAKGQWEVGLPYLAKGNDARLVELARQEITTSKSAADQVALAEQWHGYAERTAKTMRNAINSHALDLYEKALPGLEGLKKAGVQTKIDELRKSVTPAVARAGVVRTGNVALASNGTTVTGTKTGAAWLIDGNVKDYDTSSGFAWSSSPADWTITFDKTYQLQLIRFLIWDKDVPKPRVNRYKLLVSANGRDFTPLKEGEGSSWQEITFPPQPIKAVRLLDNRAGEFCIVEFEAYCIPLRK